jgi:ABC-type glycerol-3-phosphate transport system permease component
MGNRMIDQVKESRSREVEETVVPPSSVPAPGSRPPTSVFRQGWEGVRYALLAIYAILCLYPFFWMLSASLRTSAGVFSAGLSLWVDEPQWANYAEIWQEANVPRAAFVTVVITAVCMAVTILTTSMTAFAVTRSDFPGRRLVMVALLTTFLIPGEMLIIPTFYINRALHLIGDWRSVIAVILVMTAGAQVFNIYLLIGHFRTLPPELYDAALVDGETYFGMYRRIAFPLVRPALATIALLTFMGVWNAYLVPLVYLAPLRDYQTLTIALVQYSKQFQTLYHIMAAGAVITLVPIIVVFIFLQRYFVRGLTEGATKG